MKRAVEILINIVFWFATTWIIVELFTVEYQRIEIINGVETITARKDVIAQNILLLGSIFKIALFYLNYFIITKKLSSRLNVRSYALTMCILIPVFFLLESTVSILIYDIEFAALPNILNMELYFFYFSISSAYGFIKVWIVSENRKRILEKEKQTAELNFLRAQLNPHFLFNTLNNILSMSQKSNNIELSESISKLSHLMRYLLYEINRDKVVLSKEIEFIKDFIELNLLRYDKDELDVSFQILGDPNEVLIEPGILIFFVENAFKHGVSIENNSFIKLKADLTNENVILFELSNSLLESPTKPNDRHGGMGMKNIRDRLNLVYGAKYELHVDENQNEFRVSLKINLI